MPLLSVTNKKKYALKHTFLSPMKSIIERFLRGTRDALEVLLDKLLHVNFPLSSENSSAYFATRHVICEHLSRELLPVLVICFLEENGTTPSNQHLEDCSSFESGMGETDRHEAI